MLKERKKKEETPSKINDSLCIVTGASRSLSTQTNRLLNVEHRSLKKVEKVMGMWRGKAGCDSRRGAGTQCHPAPCTPSTGQAHPSAGNPVGNTIQGWQGSALTTVCTDGRNKMFPSLLFLDRHVAKVEEEHDFCNFFFPSLTCGGWFSSP